MSLRRLLGLTACIIALSPLCPAFAGPLDPPAGPIAPTTKPLGEVEPRMAINAANTPGDADSVFRIAQPGSYYLVGNVTGMAGKNGIEVAASGVTIDLNGFKLQGVPGSISGIATSAGGDSTTLRNGHVALWPGDGVSLAGRARVEGITATSNSANGIVVGADSLVTGCIATSNGGSGVRASGCCVTVVACHAGANSDTGIDMLTSATVIDCTASGNAIDGVFVGAKGTVRRCSSTSNGFNGVFVSSHSVIAENTCSDNTRAGIFVAGDNNRLEANNCTDNARGFDVAGTRNIIVRNACSANSPANWTIVAGNVVLVVRATSAGPVSGDLGGTAPGSTDPNANFTY